MKDNLLFVMRSADCNLPVTGEDGFVIQFWANSSYGDSSEIFDALVRVAVADAGDPDRSFWYVDVLSSQWVGVPVASCVQAWGVTARWRTARMVEHPTESEEAWHRYSL